MSAKRKHRTTNEYLKYLKGEFSREERYSFERDLEADPFEMEALEGMEQSTAAELEEDLLSLHATLQKRLRRRRRRTLYYVAASVASFLIVGTVFLNVYEINPKSASESIPDDEIFLHEDAGVQSEEEAPIQEKALVREEKFVPEEKAMLAAEVVSDEVEAPAPVANEIVALEAQPQRSRKKGRTQEATISYSANRVSGIVVSSEDQEPLPGAGIMVKGSDSGMVADMDGRFSLVADQQSQTTVIASYIGMETDEYQLAGGKENRVVMQPDMATLDEVVVIRYEANNEAYATGAVQKVQLDREESRYSGAEPEGGLEGFKMYIEEHIRFPAGDTISKREVVVLKFKVAQDGTVSNIQTLRSPGDLFSEEAIRMLQEGPVWNPARNESGVTEDVVRMRIVFKR